MFSQGKTKTKPGYTESVAGHSHIHTSGYSTDSQKKSCKFKDATKSKENNNDSGHWRSVEIMEGINRKSFCPPLIRLDRKLSDI